jgi:transitional endoplasmic reticulum ATPase
MAAPSILFFDEIDALIPQRGTGIADARVTEKVISQFLTEMDGIEILGDVVVAGATNRPDLLDTAILRAGRFDVVFELSLPDRDARKKILSVHTRRMPLDSKTDLEELAVMTEGFAGSEISWLCDQALRLAIERVIEKHPDRAAEPPFELKVKRKHFLQALKTLKVRSAAIPEP